jgi:hypothetical protein
MEQKIYKFQVFIDGTEHFIYFLNLNLLGFELENLKL